MAPGCSNWKIPLVFPAEKRAKSFTVFWSISSILDEHPLTPQAIPAFFVRKSGYVNRGNPFLEVHWLQHHEHHALGDEKYLHRYFRGI